MAVVTTCMTAPLIGRLVRKTELEPFFESSAFVQQLRLRDRRNLHPNEN